VDQAVRPMQPRVPAPGKPWRIGWFGAIRCAKSLQILTDFAARMDGKVEIVLRGRPAYSEFADFDAQVAAAPYVEFLGSYRNPEDLSEIYRDVQFTWAIDFFEEGLNSDWLLPNRLYEGSLHGAVPITLSSTETGRFVAGRDMGVALDRVTPDALETLFGAMDAETYSDMFARLTAIDRRQWVTDAADCRALVARLAALTKGFPPPAAMPVPSTEQSRGVVMVSREPSHAPEIDAVGIGSTAAGGSGDGAPAPVAASDAPVRAAYNLPVADDPRTLIVIPALNEAATIDPLIRKLDKQRQGYDVLIVVADGGSRDGTQEIVKKLAQEIPDVVLLNNPKKIQSAAINLAVRRFGDDRDYLIRIDAHGDYPDNYCRALIREAMALQADSVVVGMETVGFSTFQKATAAAQNSRLGNGGSKHRAGGSGQWIDHGHHALMRIAAFLAVGGYDETFSHNEDAELDYRLREMGFRIWMTSKTYMTYYPRSSAAALFRQYLGYGRGRARNLLKHRSIPKVRQAIPLAVAPVVIGAVLALMYWWAAVPFVLWAAACLSYGFWMAVGRRNPYGPLAAVSAMIMHFAWSAGFWLELIGIRKRSVA
jgi:succinoglycan biosynthesis protein ExoL